MKTKGLPLASVRMRNFKAIQDTGALKFSPFTVLIGNNGSGKSSLIEGLEMFQAIVAVGVDKAMAPWFKFEHVWNQAVDHTGRTDRMGQKLSLNPMSFSLRGRQKDVSFKAQMDITAGEGDNWIIISEEQLRIAGKWPINVTRDADGSVVQSPAVEQATMRVPLGRSCFGVPAVQQRLGAARLAEEWQFLSLQPHNMGNPVPQARAAERVRLEKDGSNIAQYVLELRNRDPAAFEGILESMRYVLPYALDLQPVITSELERAVYLQMSEGKFKVPGWLLSTGTLRILSLLALLRHPTPPPLVVIEEIENGLDPRTINLLIEEIKAANDEGIQVIATTHSPYLLDSVPLESVVLVERVDGEPKFTRPADSEEVQRWAKEFTTGRLYTMSRLNDGRA